MPEGRCGFGPCGCFPAPGLAYCGPRCAESDRPERERAEAWCRCGHPDCQRSDESGAGGD